MNSLVVAGGSAVLALALGGGVALFALTLSPPWRRFLLAGAVAVLALPAFLTLNAWFSLFGVGGVLEGRLPFSLFSLPATLLLETLLYWPISFLLVLGAWQRLTPELLEADPLLRRGALWRWLLWPAARSASGVALAVTFVLALNQFAVPALLQVKVYPAEVWVRYNAGLDPLGALGLSWPMVLAPAILLACAWRRDVPWPRWSGGVGHRLARERLGSPASCLAAGLSGITLVLALGFPLSQLLLSRGTWLQLPAALQAGYAAVVQTAWTSALTATLVVLLALATSRWRWPAVSWLGFLVPGVVVGVVIIKVFNRPVLFGFYQGVSIVLLAWGLRYFAPGWAIVRRALRSLDPLLRDALRLEGAGPWAAFRLAIWPQAGIAIGAAWYLVFLLCLWDTETLVLIMPPGGETLALRIFNFLHYGHNDQVNALCFLLLLLALAPLALWALGRWVSMRRKARPGRAQALTLSLLAAGTAALSGCRPPNSSHAALTSAIFELAEVFGERGSGPGQFQKPRSLTVDAQDNLYVVDMTGRVQKFSPEGEYLMFWQMPQTDLGKPKGMCLDEQGHVVVVEPHYARINRFTPDGQLVDRWGVKGTRQGQLGFPRAVVVSPEGFTYVSEYLQQERVQVFTPQHQFVRALGRAGRGEGEFNRCEGLALDAAGRLYVADSCNHRVQVFSEQGTFLRAIGQPGSGPGEMSYPYDVVVDPEGRLYVCEFGNSRIQVFDREGRWLETVGGAGVAPGQFSNPWSLALDSHGNLYVADSMNHRIQKLIRRRSTS